MKQSLWIFLLIPVMLLTGCSARSAINACALQQTDEVYNTQSPAPDETEAHPLFPFHASCAAPTPTAQPEKNPLCTAAADNKVCLKIAPAIVSSQIFYYDILPEDLQPTLSAWLDTACAGAQPYARKWEELDLKELGWQIIQGQIRLTAMEDGYFYTTYTDETGNIMECCFQDITMSEQLAGLLRETYHYTAIDPSELRGITAAALEIDAGCVGATAGALYGQTITDPEILALFESWFCGAKYLYGGADCASNLACLSLTLDSGKTVRLSLATDDCPVFGLNGVYYDYTPKAYQAVRGWHSSEFFAYFDDLKPLNP